jgi:membrane protein DedA with SNARE-associated domain/rhodanese-related sulfurtransferase
MKLLLDLLSHYGPFFVFACVLAEQAGLPLPAYPVLLAAGSLAAQGQQSAIGLTIAAVLACLLADSMWYWAGKRLGQRVLALLCGLSLSADSCVRQTQAIFRRWGAPSLVLAKFVPGFATVATAMAGSTRIGRVPFGAYDLVGSALWAGSGLALGWIFGAAVDDVLATLAEMGLRGVLLLAGLLALYLAVKAWRRRAYAIALRIDGISIEEFRGMLATLPPAVVDARANAAAEEHRIPGAIPFNETKVHLDLAHISRDTVVVVYCDCPGEVSAVQVARKLKLHGFRSVRPLRGGLKAWRTVPQTAV